MSEKQMKFLIISEFGELLDLAIHLKNEGNEVLFHVPNHDYAKIGEGIVPKTDDSMVEIGKGWIWVFDGCARGKRQDWLRSKGELVFGGTEKTDKLENDRQMGQQLFKSAGFYQPVSRNFKDFDAAIKFATTFKGRLIMKQNGDAPKSINHMGKFDDGSDMIYHLTELKKSWSETRFGKVDFDLMEVVEGLEVAASAFFNGSDYLRDKEGRVVGFLNFEEKKEIDGNLGETTGEMGTTFVGCTEKNQLFKDIMLKPKVVDVLRKLDYRGVFDINCIKTDKGIVALEPTCRFGIPATSYEFDEGLITPAGEVIAACAKGESIPVEIHKGVGMVMVIAAKPYPVESDIEDSATSIGERLWVLDKGVPIDDFTDDQMKHFHLQNFYKEDGMYRVATKNGYLFTVTGRGDTVKKARKSLIQYIKDNVYISGMKYRSDIGNRIEGYMDEEEKTEKEKTEKELADEKIKHDKELLKKELYGANS